jgi:hypothetical protein
MSLVPALHLPVGLFSRSSSQERVVEERRLRNATSAIEPQGQRVPFSDRQSRLRSGRATASRRMTAPSAASEPSGSIRTFSKRFAGADENAPPGSSRRKARVIPGGVTSRMVGLGVETCATAGGGAIAAATPKQVAKPRARLERPRRSNIPSPKTAAFRKLMMRAVHLRNEQLSAAQLQRSTRATVFMSSFSRASLIAASLERPVSTTSIAPCSSWFDHPRSH